MLCDWMKGRTIICDEVHAAMRGIEPLHELVGRGCGWGLRVESRRSGGEGEEKGELPEHG